MRLAVGGDHAGLAMKGRIVPYLEALGHDVIDLGTHSPEPVDFPDIAASVCRAVRTGGADRGVMVCGTGVGAAIAANKTPGIRASVIHDIYSARQCVEHDDVNVACIGAQVIGAAVAEEVLRAFLRATFSSEEHFRRRVRKLHELERTSARETLGLAEDSGTTSSEP